MTLLHQLTDPEIWARFLDYKRESGNYSAHELADLESYVAQKGYISTLAAMQSRTPIPRKRLISKTGSDKRRTVYIYSTEENYLLKLLTYLLIRTYDHLFANNLFSFRASHGIREAANYLRRDKNLSKRYVYKLDISDYFNSVDIDLLLPILREALADDVPTYEFIARLLLQPEVLLPDGRTIRERKGIMAGVPLASFLANLYLAQLDWMFHDAHFRYARYSDDIILLASSAEKRAQGVEMLHQFLADKHLTINPKKELWAEPEEKWNFLGISYCQGVFDVSEVSARKLCMKMRRKCHKLLRWKHQKKVANDKVAKVFIRLLNRKLYEHNQPNDLTWSRWFFPLINTTETLGHIDRYMEDCVRYLVTERHSKRRFNCRYQELKNWGFRSLVHEYYLLMKNSAPTHETHETHE